MSRFNVLALCLLLANVPSPERLGEVRKVECGAEFQQEITVTAGDLIQISATGSVIPEGKLDNLKVEISKQDAAKIQSLGSWSVPAFDKSGNRIVGGLGLLEMMTLVKTIEPGNVTVKVTTVGKDFEGNTFEIKVTIVPPKPAAP